MPERVVRASLIETGQNIIAGTPVDKGRARNSWNTAIGTPDTTVRLDTSTSGADALQNLEGVASVLEVGQELFFTSDLIYMPRLEYEGHSQQAPQGMVRINLADFQQTVQANIKRQGLGK